MPSDHDAILSDQLNFFACCKFGPAVFHSIVDQNNRITGEPAAVNKDSGELRPCKARSTQQRTCTTSEGLDATAGVQGGEC